jgi:hypothetical protein
MPDRPIEELAETIRTKASARSTAQDPLKRQEAECHIGEQVFCSIFAQDTSILGPWQLKTGGTRTNPKYLVFKQRWDQLCSQENLGVAAKELTAWCRARALERLLMEKGLDPNELDWTQLTEIQRLRAVSQMVEEARKAMQSATLAKAESPAPSAVATVGKAAEMPTVHATAQIELSQPPALAELQRLIENPSELLQRSDYVELLSSPASLKEMPHQERDQLLATVEAMAKRLKTLAHSYRDFEAALRWSRRF